MAMKIPEERRAAIETAILEAVARGAKHGDHGNGLLRSIADHHPDLPRKQVSTVIAGMVRDGKVEAKRKPDTYKPKTQDEDEPSERGKFTLRDYQRMHKRLIPYKERAQLRADAIRLITAAGVTDTKLRAITLALKALQNIDELDGLIAQAKESAGHAPPGPMFMLPEGTTFEIDAPTPAHIEPLAFEEQRQAAMTEKQPGESADAQEPQTATA